MSKPKKFDFDSGALCLDFCNTVTWHAGQNPVEHIQNYEDLLLWAEQAQILTPERAVDLRQKANEQSNLAWKTLTYAVQLREAIYRIFVANFNQEPFDEADLNLFNQALSVALTKMQITPVDAKFGWGWKEYAPDLKEFLGPVVHSASELLTSDELDRVKQCADDRGCGYLFLDTSRNRSRRWCSMEACGNRAKVMRHYHKKQNQ